MSERELWTNIKGTRFVVGTIYNTPDYAARHLKAKPIKKLDTRHPAFELLEDLLLQWGYHPEITKNGSVITVIPIRDEYGRICREIAKTYYMVLNSVAHVRQRLTKEAVY